MRGLGESQYRDRLMTKYKIVCLLNVTAFTYEQLWEVSRIQRNMLRKNLDSLVDEGTVWVHNYSIPYTREFYGYMYKYPVPYMPPLNGRKYYLLDCSQRQCDAYMNFYYNNKAKERREPFDELLIEEKRKSQKKLCRKNDTRLSKEELGTKLRWEEMTSTELRNEWEICMDQFICLARRMREDELIAVKFGERFQYERSMMDKELDNITRVAEFFTKKGYSLLDVLIRCSTEYTIVNTTGYTYDLHLSLIPYSLLWKIMEKAGLLKGLIQAK
jgi:hypothetical protein